MESKADQLRKAAETRSFTNGINRLLYLPCALALFAAAQLYPDQSLHPAFLSLTAVALLANEFRLWRSVDKKFANARLRRQQLDVVRSFFPFEAKLIADLEGIFPLLGIPVEPGATLSELAATLSASNEQWTGTKPPSARFSSISSSLREELWRAVLTAKRRAETWLVAERHTRGVRLLRGNCDKAAMNLLVTELGVLSSALWSKTHFKRAE